MDFEAMVMSWMLCCATSFEQKVSPSHSWTGLLAGHDLKAFLLNLSLKLNKLRQNISKSIGSFSRPLQCFKHRCSTFGCTCNEPTKQAQILQPALVYKMERGKKRDLLFYQKALIHVSAYYITLNICNWAQSRVQPTCWSVSLLPSLLCSLWIFCFLAQTTAACTVLQQLSSS